MSYPKLLSENATPEEEDSSNHLRPGLSRIFIALLMHGVTAGTTRNHRPRLQKTALECGVWAR